MPIRGSPNGARHPRPQAGRDRPEWVVAINRNAWSQSIGIAGRDHPVRAARASIGRYLNFYNGRRPHSSLDGSTPDQAYFNQLPLRLAA